MNERQDYILTQLRDIGYVQVDHLASAFDVTSQTIRRDLSELCNQGLAMRIHGGARRAQTTSTIDYEKRRELGISAKSKIAQQAAKLIADGSSVAINIGTTTEQVAEAIKYHKNLTVVTNNINVVHILRPARLKSLIIVGGEVRLVDGAIIGADAQEGFAQYKCDVAVIGASSLDNDGSVLDFDKREVAVARTILHNARTRILVCDHSKFNVSASHRICNVELLDFIVTDKSPSLAFRTAVKRGGTNLIVTEEQDDEKD